MDMHTVSDMLADIAANVQLYVVPYAAFFAGIYIRRRYFAEPDTPPLKALLALGVIVCFVVVTPIIQAARMTLIEFGLPYLATIGLIMEQGMVPHENTLSRLQRALPGGRSSKTPEGSELPIVLKMEDRAATEMAEPTDGHAGIPRRSGEPHGTEAARQQPVVTARTEDA